VLTATARAKSDPVYRKKLEEAASKPINIAVMSSLFWALPVSHTQGCKVDGIPLDCHIQSGGTEVGVSGHLQRHRAVPSSSRCAVLCRAVPGIKLFSGPLSNPAAAAAHTPYHGQQCC
jgi:hypothetical protein